MGTNAVLSPWETTSALTRNPASTSKVPPESKWGGGVCDQLNTPQLHQQQKKTQTGECRDRGFEGGYSSRGCQTTEPPDCGYGPPKATVSCARPLSPATGPSQDLDQRQLRVRRGTKWTLFRQRTRRGRYALQTPPWRGVHATPIKGNHISAAVKKQLNVVG